MGKGGGGGGGGGGVIKLLLIGSTELQYAYLYLQVEDLVDITP
jgi:hypothetical protein